MIPRVVVVSKARGLDGGGDGPEKDVCSVVKEQMHLTVRDGDRGNELERPADETPSRIGRNRLGDLDAGRGIRSGDGAEDARSLDGAPDRSPRPPDPGRDRHIVGGEHLPDVGRRSDSPNDPELHEELTAPR